MLLKQRCVSSFPSVRNGQRLERVKGRLLDEILLAAAIRHVPEDRSLSE